MKKNICQFQCNHDKYVSIHKNFVKCIFRTMYLAKNITKIYFNNYKLYSILKFCFIRTFVPATLVLLLHIFCKGRSALLVAKPKEEISA